MRKKVKQILYLNEIKDMLAFKTWLGSLLKYSPNQHHREIYEYETQRNKHNWQL